MHVLIIDDELALRQIIAATVRRAGYSVDMASGVKDAAAKLVRGDVDLAIYPERNASESHPLEHLLDESYSCVVWTGFHLSGRQLGYEQYMAAREQRDVDQAKRIVLTDDRPPYFFFDAQRKAAPIMQSFLGEHQRTF